MTNRFRSILVLVLLACVCCVGMPAAAQHAAAPMLIHLRRASFDPLTQAMPRATMLRANVDSQLLLVQLQQPPDATTPATLVTAGLRPLAYVPDNAFVVRADSPAQQLRAPWLRWIEPFEPGYKLARDLDAPLERGLRADATASESADVRLLATPDAAPGTLAVAVRRAGGTVINEDNAATGATLHVRVATRALPQLLQRDDLLWIEPFVPLRLTNDKANQIVGVPIVRQQYGLDGSGQIVAVTDTGLDVQESLSADFAGRVARGFSRQEMSPDCSIYDNGATWSDANGHGTHVAGTLLGSGALSPQSGPSFAGVAPNAQVVVQAVSSGGAGLDCLPEGGRFLALAYDAGARVQSASFGGPTGQSGDEAYGRYTLLDQAVDTFLWQHKDHLFVVSAGNSGIDQDSNGVVDGDSIEQPATAKNVLSVGASENNRPPTSTNCAPNTPQNTCWRNFFFTRAPLADDFISDNPNGIAAFSSRGPTDDGRIKPEIVAPGTNIISARSHDPAAYYDTPYNQDYAYESGTSMSTPMVSGLAALTRQWLAQQRGITTPSAALVKALLLNGAANLGPGQYGDGPQREIPAAWPNNVAGWGRADIAATTGHGDPQQVWLNDNAAGLQTGQTASYTLQVSAEQPLRVTLAWTDYPATPIAQKALVNDLDLEVQTPTGTVLGNASAAVPPACRSAEGADRCNMIESVDIPAPQAGTYVVRVRASVVAQGGTQPFAVVVGAQRVSTAPPPPAPVLHSLNSDGGPVISFAWSSSAGATRYEVEQRIVATNGITTVKAIYPAAGQSFTLVEDVGVYEFRVRGCNDGDCGDYSAPLRFTVATPPRKTLLPLVGR